MQRHPLRALAASLLVVSALSSLSACPGDPLVQLQLCGDWSVPSGLDAIRVSTLSEDRQTETYAGVFELVVCAADGSVVDLRQLPVQLSFTAPDTPMWVVIQGLKDGAEVMKQEVRIKAQPQADIQVPVRFTQSCGGVDCPLGQTCVDGECVITPYWDTDPMSCDNLPVPTPPDGGSTASDAGATDAAAGPDADPTLGGNGGTCAP